MGDVGHKKWYPCLFKLFSITNLSQGNRSPTNVFKKVISYLRTHLDKIYSESINKLTLTNYKEKNYDLSTKKTQKLRTFHYFYSALNIFVKNKYY